VKVDTGPPTITTSISGTAGNPGWYVSPTTTAISATDFSGIDHIEYSQNNEGWQNGSSIVSDDGVNQIAIRVQDVAGNIASTSLEIKVDTVAPTISTFVSGTAGLAGWYISPTTTNVSSMDETSGMDRIKHNQNSTGWQTGSTIVSNDGVSAIDIQAYDVAGNMTSHSLQVKVDTEKPISKFVAPENGSTNTIARGSYSFSGLSSDTTSGVSSAEISLDGNNWIPLDVSLEGTWSYDWDTAGWSDGVYPVVVRGTDLAGNTELVVAAAQVVLLVNNAPPHIKLTPDWFIWESGSLLIKTEYFPIKDGTVVIADPQGRWPRLKIPFGTKYPAEIKWDRRFANGVLAPSGNYRVTVSACNVYDLCAEKSATIKIPFIAVVLPSIPVPTDAVEVEQEVRPDVKKTIETPQSPVVESASPANEIQVQSKAGHKPVPSLFPFVVLISLMWAVSSAALADKRPMAIHAIAQTIILQKHKGEIKYE
jgi:hypothetical protein